MTLPQCKSLRCMPPKGSSSRSSTSRSVGRALAASTRRRSCCTTRRDARILDVGGQEGPGYNARKTVAEAEEAGRRTAAAVRGADPGAVPTRALVGTQLRDLPLAAAPVDARTYTRHRRTCSGSEGARRRYNRSTARNLAGSSFRRDLGGTLLVPIRPRPSTGPERLRT